MGTARFRRKKELQGTGATQTKTLWPSPPQGPASPVYFTSLTQQAFLVSVWPLQALGNVSSLPLLAKARSTLHTLCPWWLAPVQ